MMSSAVIFQLLYIFFIFRLLKKSQISVFVLGVPEQEELR